ncbi:MAG: hypothetical protein ACE5PM_01745 [Candidatus Hydrothermarchaeales archaeon]
MSAVQERLLSELNKMEKEAKDENTLKEIALWKIKLQRGSLRGKAEPSPLTYEEKEEALKEYLRERGLKWPGVED